MNAALPFRISRKAAFTMTEIALCIAIIGIALVAIIGVLPSGLTVQKQNREDALVAQDSQFLIESIRSGSLGISDLTNNVDYIRWRRAGAESFTEYYRGPNYLDPLPGTPIPITDAWQVLALLSVPRYETRVIGRKVVVVENEVTAQFRSLSSPFSEKSYRDGPARSGTLCHGIPLSGQRGGGLGGDPAPVTPPFLYQSGGLHRGFQPTGSSGGVPE